MSIREREVKPAGAWRLGIAAACAAAAFVSAPAARAADQGMTVVKDPVTGQLRAPTAEEFESLHGQSRQRAARSLAPKAVAPTETRRADGSSKLLLDESYMSYSVVVRNADGSLDEQCVVGADAADKLVVGAKVSTAGKNGKATAKNAKEQAHDHQ